jgi:ATP-dependent Lon protease
MLPLRDLVFFPHMATPIFLGREKSMRALEHALAGDGRLLVITQRRAGDDDPGPDALYRVGVTVSVIHHLTLGEGKAEAGTVRLFVQGLERAAVTRFTDGQFWSAEVAPIEELRAKTPEAEGLVLPVLKAYQAYANVDLASPPQALVRHISDPSTLADTLAQLLSIGIDRRQELLETGDVIARLEKVLELMKAGRQAA